MHNGIGRKIAGPMQTLVNAIQALLTFLLCGMRLGLYLSAPMAACVYICLPVAVSPWLYFFTSASEKLMAVFVHVLGRGWVCAGDAAEFGEKFSRLRMCCACACACAVEPSCAFASRLFVACYPTSYLVWRVAAG